MRRFEADLDPLLPASYDLVWMVGAGVTILLAVVALVVLARNKRHSALMALVWAVVIIAVPVAGPVLYLLARRDDRPAPAKATTAQRPELTR